MVTILADVGDELKIIEEEKQLWLHKVLIALGANKEIISKNTIEAKRHLSVLNLDVDMHTNGFVEIVRLEFLSNNEETKTIGRKVIAQWFPPKLIKIKNSPKDYYRIVLNEWALPFQMGDK
jgi:hypothetical protein